MSQTSSGVTVSQERARIMNHESTLSPHQRREIVLTTLRGDDSIGVLSTRYGIPEATLHRWRDDFLQAGEAALAYGTASLLEPILLAARSASFSHVAKKCLMGLYTTLDTILRKQYCQADIDLRDRLHNLRSLLDTMSDAFRHWATSLAEPHAHRLPRCEDPGQILTDCVNSFSRTCAEGDITLRLDPVPMIAPVSCSRIELEEVIRQLLMNAVDAVEACEEKEIVVSAILTSEEEVQISVRDSGIGMSEEMLGNLFKIGFTTGQDKLGLGLCIVRTVAERHGGIVECCKTSPGSGSTFSVRLPLDKSG